MTDSILYICNFMYMLRNSLSQKILNYTQLQYMYFKAVLVLKSWHICCGITSLGNYWIKKGQDTVGNFAWLKSVF